MFRRVVISLAVDFFGTDDFRDRVEVLLGFDEVFAMGSMKATQF